MFWEFSCSEILQRLQGGVLTTVYLVTFSRSTHFSGDLWGNGWSIIWEFPLRSETNPLGVQFRPFPQSPLHSLRHVALLQASLWPCGPMCSAFFSDLKFPFFRPSNEDFFLIIWSGMETLILGENLLCNPPLYRNLSKFNLWWLFLFMHHCLWYFCQLASKRKFGRKSTSLSSACPKSWCHSIGLFWGQTAWVTFSVQPNSVLQPEVSMWTTSFHFFCHLDTRMCPQLTGLISGHAWRYILCTRVVVSSNGSFHGCSPFGPIAQTPDSSCFNLWVYDPSRDGASQDNEKLHWPLGKTLTQTMLFIWEAHNRKVK